MPSGFEPFALALMTTTIHTHHDGSKPDVSELGHNYKDVSLLLQQ